MHFISDGSWVHDLQLERLKGTQGYDRCVQAGVNEPSFSLKVYSARRFQRGASCRARMEDLANGFREAHKCLDEPYSFLPLPSPVRSDF